MRSASSTATTSTTTAARRWPACTRSRSSWRARSRSSCAPSSTRGRRWPTRSPTTPRPSRLYGLVTTYYLLISGWVVAGLALLGRWVLRLLAAPQYFGAYRALPWVALGWALYGLWVVFLVIAGRAQVTTRNFPAALAGLAANVLLIVLLVPSLGIAGAGIALCGAYVVMLAVMYLLTRAAFAVAFEWRRLAQLRPRDGRGGRGSGTCCCPPTARSAFLTRGGVPGDPAGAVPDRVRPPAGARAAARTDSQPAALARAHRRERTLMRPTVSVVMPFAGDVAARAEAIGALLALTRVPGDELILADNLARRRRRLRRARVRSSGPAWSARRHTLATSAPSTPAANGSCSSTPTAGRPAICSTPTSRRPIGPDVGALAGEVVPAARPATLAERYGAARGFLSAQAHLAHPYLPRAVAANLLVRRVAFEQVGGFYEGVRAAEDTDFSWRLQRAGWRLELRHHALVEHRYRTTLGDLRRQWRGYAAGRAWLARRYDGFEPQPAVARVRGRGLASLRGVGVDSQPPAHRCPGPRRCPRSADSRRRGTSRSTDCWPPTSWLGSRSPTGPTATPRASAPIRVVLVAERFPARATRWSTSPARWGRRAWRRRRGRSLSTCRPHAR